MKKNYISTLIISVVLFTGCTNNIFQNNKTVITQEPKWLDDPYIENDKFAAVGCSSRHTNGITAQKKLAISRALDAIAAQVKVNVQNVKLNKKLISNGRMNNSTTESSSLQTVDNVSVSTKVKATFKKNNGEICSWVVSR